MTINIPYCSIHNNEGVLEVGITGNMLAQKEGNELVLIIDGTAIKSINIGSRDVTNILLKNSSRKLSELKGNKGVGGLIFEYIHNMIVGEIKKKESPGDEFLNKIEHKHIHIKIGKLHCPVCQSLVDAVSDLGEGKAPVPRDYTICCYCGSLLIFTDDMDIDVVSKVELDLIDGNSKADIITSYLMLAASKIEEKDNTPFLSKPGNDILKDYIKENLLTTL